MDPEPCSYGKTISDDSRVAFGDSTLRDPAREAEYLQKIKEYEDLNHELHQKLQKIFQLGMNIQREYEEEKRKIIVTENVNFVNQLVQKIHAKYGTFLISESDRENMCANRTFGVKIIDDYDNRTGKFKFILDFKKSWSENNKLICNENYVDSEEKYYDNPYQFIDHICHKHTVYFDKIPEYSWENHNHYKIEAKPINNEWILITHTICNRANVTVRYIRKTTLQKIINSGGIKFPS